MRERHRETNMACRAQTYTLRSSFFDYLGRTYGDSVIVAMASREPAGALEDYEDLLGEEFDTLAVEWRQFLVESYRNIPDREVKADRFRTESPIQYIPVCGAEDY